MENTIEIERACLDLRYEHHRIRNSKIEDGLLQSIVKNGIRKPLRGVEVEDIKVLLDGFKRLRCAKILNIDIVPYVSIGEDEAMGIIELLRDSFSKKLDIIEQAKLIDELQNGYDMSIAEIAVQLEKSKAWVSLRAGMLKEISPFIAEKLLKGKLPVRSYLYSIAPFTRVNGIKQQEVDGFVKLIAGKSITTRDIDVLARGYFQGSKEIRDQIETGNLEWGVAQLKKQHHHYPNGCTEFERRVIRHLELVRSNMQKLSVEIRDKRLKTDNFRVQSDVLIEGILQQKKGFLSLIESVYDQPR